MQCISFNNVHSSTWLWSGTLPELFCFFFSIFASCFILSLFDVRRHCQQAATHDNPSLRAFIAVKGCQRQRASNWCRPPHSIKHISPLIGQLSLPIMEMVPWKWVRGKSAAQLVRRHLSLEDFQCFSGKLLACKPTPTRKKHKVPVQPWWAGSGTSTAHSQELSPVCPLY